MKSLFTILLFSFWSFTAQAMCSMSGVWCWPNSPTIRPNGIIMIEFYAYSQNMVEGLKSKYPLYLKSGGDSMALQIIEVLKGQMELTQIILRPEKQLSVGLTYELLIANLPKEHRSISKWDGQKKIHTPYSWMVSGESDVLAPVWKQKPVYKKKEYIAYGCGPAELVYFTSSGEYHSDVLVKTTVKSLNTGKSSSYYLTTENGALQIGHGMCSGAFTFRDGKEYEVVFSLMDASGNQGCEQTKAIRFSRPEPKDGGW